ncbi:MAG: hypothetical protein SangKO_068000 [Sandaracinaceae bacterium]
MQHAGERAQALRYEPRPPLVRQPFDVEIDVHVALLELETRSLRQGLDLRHREPVWIEVHAKATRPIFARDVNATDALATVQRGAEAIDAGVGVARYRGKEKAEVELDCLRVVHAVLRATR